MRQTYFASLNLRQHTSPPGSGALLVVRG